MWQLEAFFLKKRKTTFRHGLLRMLPTVKWDEREVETGWCSHCVTHSEHTRQVRLRSAAARSCLQKCDATPAAPISAVLTFSV